MDFVEIAILSVILSGVLWNVLVGYRVVPSTNLSAYIALTAGLLFVVLSYDLVDRPA